MSLSSSSPLFDYGPDSSLRATVKYKTDYIVYPTDSSSTFRNSVNQDIVFELDTRNGSIKLDQVNLAFSAINATGGSTATSAYNFFGRVKADSLSGIIFEDIQRFDVQKDIENGFDCDSGYVARLGKLQLLKDASATTLVDTSVACVLPVRNMLGMFKSAIAMPMDCGKIRLTFTLNTPASQASAGEMVLSNCRLLVPVLTLSDAERSAQKTAIQNKTVQINYDTFVHRQISMAGTTSFSMQSPSNNIRALYARHCLDNVQKSTVHANLGSSNVQAWVGEVPMPIVAISNANGALYVETARAHKKDIYQSVYSPLATYDQYSPTSATNGVDFSYGINFDSCRSEQVGIELGGGKTLRLDVNCPGGAVTAGTLHVFLKESRILWVLPNEQFTVAM